MSPLFTYNQKLLVVDSKLAANELCCCEPPSDCTECGIYGEGFGGGNEYECVLFLQGRTGTGLIFDPAFTESWSLGSSLRGGFWVLSETPSETPEDLADKDYAISVGGITCEGGKWVVGRIDVGLGTTQVRSTISSSYEGLSGVETTHNYNNVKVVVDKNGCPSGLDLGDFEVQQGVNGPSVHTPLVPDVVVECNPFP